MKEEGDDGAGDGADLKRARVAHDQALEKPASPNQPGEEKEAGGGPANEGDGIDGDPKPAAEGDAKPSGEDTKPSEEDPKPSGEDPKPSGEDAEPRSKAKTRTRSRRDERREQERRKSRSVRFEKGVMRGASSKCRQAVADIEKYEWEAEAWLALVAEAQQSRSGGLSLHKVYTMLLHQFPTAGRYWRHLAQLELENGRAEAVDKILETALLECANLELWLFYIDKMKRSALGLTKTADGEGEEAARAQMIKAYELALEHVGVDIYSTPLWQDYVAYIKTWEEKTALDTGTKVTALRKVYHRAISLPLENLDRVYHDYEAFEMSRSEHLAKAKFIPEHLPKYQAAKAVLRERRQIWDGISLNQLACPPTNTHLEMQQAELWRGRIAYEQGNPERVDVIGLYTRVRLAYRQCVCCLRHYPEVWHEFAEFEAESGHRDKAAEVYEKAITVLPSSELLRVAAADNAERRGLVPEAKKLWLAFITDHPRSSVAHVLHERFIRRAEGKEAARRVFASTRSLRLEGRLGPEVYIGHAAIELRINQEPEVAQRVLEYGLSHHSNFIKDVPYVMAYIDLLVTKGDEDNLRVLFEKILDPAAMPASRAGPVWDKFIELEMCGSHSGGNLAKVEAVEKRKAAALKEHSKSSQNAFLALWKRCHLASVGRVPRNSVDGIFLDRCDMRGSAGGDDDGRDGRHDRPRRRRGDKGKDRDAEGDRKRDRDRERERAAKIPAYVPQFMHKLFGTLSRMYSAGDQPDAMSLLEFIKSCPLPEKPGASEAPSARKRKRAGQDSDEEEEEPTGAESSTHKRPAHDVFRQRQLARLDAS